MSALQTRSEDGSMKRKVSDKFGLVWSKSEDKTSFELRERGDEDNPCALARVQRKPDVEFNDGWKYAIFHPEPQNYGKGAIQQGYGSTFSSAVAMAEVGLSIHSYYRQVTISFNREAMAKALEKSKNAPPIVAKVARRLPSK